jgi:cation transport regulator ChaC
VAKTLGILAYGSLISNPDFEIEEVTTATIRNVVTPFKVEFARKSDGRSGAPTLVPVKDGGGQVTASIFVVGVAAQEARDRLYRREINQVGNKARIYREPKEIKATTVLIRECKDLGGIDVVLYTHIAATIENPTAGALAELAIASARARTDGRDGISYLKAAIANGIRTPLSDAYAEEVKRRLGARSLDEAIAKTRSPG